MIKQCIESGTAKQLSYLLSLRIQEQKEKFNIDTITIYNDQDNEINLLGYCLICNRLEMFKMLHQTFNASFNYMESYFDAFNITGLLIICEWGYLDLLEYYLPLYTLLEKIEVIKENSESKAKDTIDFTDQGEQATPDFKDPEEKKLTTIQYAVKNGHIPIVKYLLKYIASLINMPTELDIHYINKNTGYNCALIACKMGNYNMIRYLHTYQANFMILNMNKENAIQILTVHAKKRNMPDFYKCLVYLIEKIRVDITYNYEETIILLGYVNKVDYFLLQLEKLGIIVNRNNPETDILANPQIKKKLASNEIEKTYTFGNIFSQEDLQNLNEDEVSIIPPSIKSEQFSSNSILQQ